MAAIGEKPMTVDTLARSPFETDFARPLASLRRNATTTAMPPTPPDRSYSSSKRERGLRVVTVW